MLFNVYLNEALMSWRKECNISILIGDGRLFVLDFADDQATLNEDEMDVSYMPVSYTHLDVYKRQCAN